MLLGVFAVFALPALTADLWYDEVITLGDYVLDGNTPSSLRQIFTGYPAPNNHVLFSAILWVWVRLVPCMLEPVLRLPSLIFALATVLWIAFAWRRWLGTPTAFFAATLMAASPVYLHFALDLRGYGLSILLATVAVGGAMAILDRPEAKSGHLWCAGSAFLLPLVMPTNALLPIALLLFIAAARWRAKAPLARIWPDLLPTGGALVLGCSYYLLIWQQLTAAWENKPGFVSPWPVAGELASGFAAHLLPAGVLLLAVAVLRWRPAASRHLHTAAADATVPAGCGALLAGTSVMVMIATLWLMRPVPYARVFLPFLPVFTLAVSLSLRRRINLDGSLRLQLAAVGLAAGLGGIGLTASNAFTASELARGHYPQSLLCQYYYGDHSVSAAVAAIVDKHLDTVPVLLVPEPDLPAFRYYWTAFTGRAATGIYSQSRRPTPVLPPGTVTILIVTDGKEMGRATVVKGAREWPAAGTAGRFAFYAVPPLTP